MIYKSFEVENFKGIQKLSFPFNTMGSSIATLVGLNESGKTTILEALSTFYEQINGGDDLGEPMLHTTTIDDVHSLIPKGKKANFNEAIRLRASAHLDDRDRQAVADRLAEDDWRATSIGEEVTITIEFVFKNSKYQRTRYLYNFELVGRRKRRKKESKLIYDDKALWSEMMRILRTWLPPVIYYPNFLFEFPDRIAIEAVSTESKENAFYRTFLQDVLDSMGNSLDLDTHVLARAKSEEQSEREALESVMNRLGSRLTGLVFDPELSVFKVDSRGRRSVVVTLPQFDPSEKHYTVSIKLKDGDDTYFIRERSLGFRWFFTFLLLTRFRISRSTGRPPVFLFDEPASNLHQAAQQRLLRALQELTAASGVSVIYTTHSHHLIDPVRLESTFVVRNRGLAAEGLDDDFTANMTDIEITPYRTFVGSYPDQRSYFQPILDVLEYRPSNLENVPNVVMTEGKTDFYLISLFKEVLGAGKTLHFLPGGGAGGLDTPIQLYLAWGRPFLVLLDGDREGHQQRERYAELFGPEVKKRLFCLSDLDPAWRRKRLEDLLTPADRLAIQRAAFPEANRYMKKRFHIAVQECIARKEFPKVSKESRENMRRLIEGIASRIC